MTELLSMKAQRVHSYESVCCCLSGQLKMEEEEGSLLTGLFWMAAGPYRWCLV